MSVERAAAHYDEVTEAWMKWVMGEELHFGFFGTGVETLPEATQKLTDRLAARCDIAPGHRVLDVGCGIGTPGMYLAERGGARVTGISTSEVGVALANQRAEERGLADRARFELRNALDNGLPDESFDRVFSLESAHLMPDKEQLFRECYRVLAPGGKLALCDVVIIGSPEVEVAQYMMLGHSPKVAACMRESVFNTMHRAFGSSVLTQQSLYKEAAIKAGFQNVEVQDISAATRQTLVCWGDNAREHRAQIEAKLGPNYIDDFFLALLHMSFGWGRLGGYILMSGTK